MNQPMNVHSYKLMHQRAGVGASISGKIQTLPTSTSKIQLVRDENGILKMGPSSTSSNAENRIVTEVDGKFQIKSNVPFPSQSQGHQEVARQLLSSKTSNETSSARVIVQPAIPSLTPIRQPSPIKTQTFNLPQIKNVRIITSGSAQDQKLLQQNVNRNPAQQQQQQPQILKVSGVVPNQNAALSQNVAINAPNAKPIPILYLAGNRLPYNYRLITPNVVAAATIPAPSLVTSTMVRIQNTNTYFTTAAPTISGVPNTISGFPTTISTVPITNLPVSTTNLSIPVQNTIPAYQATAADDNEEDFTVLEDYDEEYEDLDLEEMAEEEYGDESDKEEEEIDTYVDEVEVEVETTPEVTPQASDSDSDIAKQFGLTSDVSILPQSKKKTAQPNVTIVKDQIIKFPSKQHEEIEPTLNIMSIPFAHQTPSTSKAPTPPLVWNQIPPTSEAPPQKPKPSQVPLLIVKQQPSTSSTPQKQTQFKLPQDLEKIKESSLRLRANSFDVSRTIDLTSESEPESQAERFTGPQTVKVFKKNRTKSMWCEKPPEPTRSHQKIVSVPPPNRGGSIVIRCPSTSTMQSLEKTKDQSNRKLSTDTQEARPLRKSTHVQEQPARASESSEAQRIPRPLRKSTHVQEVPESTPEEHQVIVKYAKKTPRKSTHTQEPQITSPCSLRKSTHEQQVVFRSCAEIRRSLHAPESDKNEVKDSLINRVLPRDATTTTQERDTRKLPLRKSVHFQEVQQPPRQLSTNVQQPPRRLSTSVQPALEFQRLETASNYSKISMVPFFEPGTKEAEQSLRRRQSTSTSEGTSQLPRMKIIIRESSGHTGVDSEKPRARRKSVLKVTPTPRQNETQTQIESDKLMKFIKDTRLDSVITSDHRTQSESPDPSTSSSMSEIPVKRQKKHRNPDSFEEPEDEEWSAVDNFEFVEGTAVINQREKISIGFNEFGVLEIPKPKELEYAQSKSAAARTQPIEFRNRDMCQGPETLECGYCKRIDLFHKFFSPDYCSLYCSNVGKKVCMSKTIKSSIVVNKNFVAEPPIRNEEPTFPVQIRARQEDSKNHLKLLEEVRKGKKRRLSEPPDNLFEKDHKKRFIFSWEEYLDGDFIKAPNKLFKTPFPSNPNLFQKHMKLEAIDPENQSLFCVCTVVEKSGFRIKLHFDGFSEDYDFWENADSPNIFPAGFCAKTNRILQVPPSREQNFSWVLYLAEKECRAAPKHIFFQLNSMKSTKNNLQIGSKLEVFDNKWSKKLKIGTIKDVLGDRVLVHFDGCDYSSSLWYSFDSPHLRVRDYHKKYDVEIAIEKDLKEFYSSDRKHFNWRKYLEETLSVTVPATALKPRREKRFKAGMKIEIVDKLTPSLIRPATVLKQKNYMIKVLYDGFDESYAYYVNDDDPDIHPVEWCKVTGHKIEFPASFINHNFRACKFPGCRGIGGFVNERPTFAHTMLEECPLLKENWDKYLSKTKKTPLRLPERRIIKQTNPKQTIATVSSIYGESSEQHEYGTDWSETLTNEEKYKCIINEHYLSGISQNIETAQRLFTYQTKQDPTIRHSLKAKNPYKWTVNEVKTYVQNLFSESILSDQDELSCKFEENEIDGACFLELTLHDLIKRLEIPFGDAMIINFSITTLRNEFILAVSRS